MLINSYSKDEQPKIAEMEHPVINKILGDQDKENWILSKGLHQISYQNYHLEIKIKMKLKYKMKINKVKKHHWNLIMNNGMNSFNKKLRPKLQKSIDVSNLLLIGYYKALQLKKYKLFKRKIKILKAYMIDTLAFCRLMLKSGQCL